MLTSQVLMMAKVEIKGIQELAKKLNRDLRIKLNILFRDKVLRENIGKIIVADIKDKVNFGQPSEATLKWRKRYDKTNTTDRAYSRGRLNAVFTGELMKDLASNVKGVPTISAFEVQNSDKLHKQYKGKNGSIGKRTPFSTISKHLIDDLGYDYLQLSKEAREDITNIIKKELYKLLR